NIQVAPGDTIPLAIQTNLTGITQVDYFADGQLVASSTTIPFSGNWIPVNGGSYELRAKVWHSGGLTGTVSQEVPVRVESQEVLFVVGGTPLNPGDAAVRTRLEAQGHIVTLVADDTLAGGDENGKRLIVVSSTVNSGLVGNLFTSTAIPLITWEPFLYDDLRMTTGAFNLTGPLSQIFMGVAGHPLSAGLTGNQPVVGTAQALSFGTPAPTAIVAGQVAGQALVFGYDEGVLMDGINAPARRVGFFLQDETAASLTTTGWQLFDAAIDWALVGGSASNPFPVELLEFDVKAVAGGASLEWTTASEQGTDYFEIQRGVDGSTFEKLTTVRAAGQSNSLLNYAHLDENPGAGIDWHYRLRMVDADGSFSYSEVRTIRLEPDLGHWQISPNPVTDHIQLLPFGTPEGSLRLVLMNAAGQVVFQKREGEVSGLAIDMSHLPTGLYFLRIQVGDVIYPSRQILKQ
ncbi:MAG: T9SS type A sorting domain-containing protein, partial [Bacteroidota bacterium]